MIDERGHRLAAAALADQAEDLAAADAERDVLDRARHAACAGADLDRQALDGERGVASAGVGAARRGVASTATSPPQPRVEDVAQAVAEGVQRQHDAGRS